MSKGAQISPTVNNLLVNQKIWDKPKMESWKPKVKPKVEAPAVKAEAKTEPAKETPAEEPKEEVASVEPEAPSQETPAA